MQLNVHNVHVRFFGGKCARIASGPQSPVPTRKTQAPTKVWPKSPLFPKVTRPEFEQATAHLFARALHPVNQVMRDQMMTPKNIDNVVLVGGASRMPKVKQLLRDIFEPPGGGKKINDEIDPDLTVAYGAASIDPGLAR